MLVVEVLTAMSVYSTVFWNVMVWVRWYTWHYIPEDGTVLCYATVCFAVHGFSANAIQIGGQFWR
jgi:hypothetical protein